MTPAEVTEIESATAAGANMTSPKPIKSGASGNNGMFNEVS